jgi:hypothetical protein
MMPVSRTSTFLKTEEVAQIMGFSVRTVTLWFNKWVETGGQEGIPGFKVGKCWRADRIAFEAWVEKLKGSPVQATEIPLRRVR